MAGKVLHLTNRSGRYYARLVVPKDLRAAVGKTELRIPLGGDYRNALRLLPGAVAELQGQIGQAERKAPAGPQREIQPRYPLNTKQLASSHYMHRLALDDELRNDQLYASISVDDLFAAQLRDGMAGKLSDLGLAELVGRQIDRYRLAGNLSAEPGSDEWREVARALCAAEYEALSRVAERDGGDFTGKPSHPMVTDAAPEDAVEPLSLLRLWDDYFQTRQKVGSMRDGGRRQAPIIKSLRTFLKHDDARRITKKDLMDWRDHLLATLSARTVGTVYLPTIRSLLKWAAENDKLPENVAVTVKQAKARRVLTREKGYTDAEALAVLKACTSYKPKPDETGRVREKPQLIAAKRWVPLICAFTGARVSEITQLRAEDVRKEGELLVIRITPEAGTVKVGGYRDVPLHRQIVAMRFGDFVDEIGKGPLFHKGTDPKGYAAKAERISNQLATWLRVSEISPEGLPPNHAWRHRLKTVALQLGLNSRVIDAIQGHSARTAGETYGDVSLGVKHLEIEKLPWFSI